MVVEEQFYVLFCQDLIMYYYPNVSNKKTACLLTPGYNRVCEAGWGTFPLCIYVQPEVP